MNNNYREELEKVYELINERKVAYEHLMKEVIVNCRIGVLINRGIECLAWKFKERVNEAEPGKKQPGRRPSPLGEASNWDSTETNWGIVLNYLSCYSVTYDSIHRTSANQDYQRQAEKNNQELLQKSKELTAKISEVDALKAKYDEALANYQNLNSQVLFSFSWTKPYCPFLFAAVPKVVQC